MAQTDILRERLFKVEKTDRNYLDVSHRELENGEAKEKKNDFNVKVELLDSVPQRFNSTGLDLPFRCRSDRDNTIFKDAEYFLKHYVYKLMPITVEEKDGKKDSTKKGSKAVVEEVDEKLISMEHDYCSVSSESDGEFEFSRMISYQVYKKRNRSKKKRRIKQSHSSVEENPKKTNEIDIINTNGSNADLHLIEPDYSEFSFYSKNLFSYKEENHFDGLQPIALSVSLPEENKTEANEIASPTENNEEKGNIAILSPTDENIKKENAETNLNSPSITILSPTENNHENKNYTTSYRIATMLSTTDNDKREKNAVIISSEPSILSPTDSSAEKVNILADFSNTAILSPIESHKEDTSAVRNCSVPSMLLSADQQKEKKVTELSVLAVSPVISEETKKESAEISIPEANNKNIVENDNIEIRFSRPGFNDYKPSRQFINNIAKKVPDLLKDKSDKVNILDCTYGLVNSDNKINYYFISEETWRLFKNSSERIVLTNDTNCGEQVKVMKENEIPTFLVFDESLADVLKTMCKDNGYKFKFTSLDDSGERFVKVMGSEDCDELEEELKESELLNNKKCDEQPPGFINSGKLRNLLLKSSLLKFRKPVGESSSVCGTSPKFDHKALPLKKSWKRDDLLLNQNAEDLMVQLWENSRKKVKKKSKGKEEREKGDQMKGYGIINSGLLQLMISKKNQNPCGKMFTECSNNLVNEIPVNQNNLLCSQMPFASQKVKKNKNNKDKKPRSKNKKTEEMSIDKIVDLGKRTGFGAAELIIAKKKRGRKKKVESNECDSAVNKMSDNSKENNSILCRLLQEPFINDNVPEYQSTEYYLDEKSGILSVRNVIDRNKLERALLSEKKKEVRNGGLKKKRELKNKEQCDEKVRVKKSKKKEARTESCKMKMSHLIEDVVKNSIMGFRSSVQVQEPPSTCIQIREPPCSNSIQVTETNHVRDMLEENSNDSHYLPRGASMEKVKTKPPSEDKRKRGRPLKKPKEKERVNQSIPEKEKIRRLSSDSGDAKTQGRPRKYNDLYSQCYMFEPNFWMENQAQIKQFLEKEGQKKKSKGKREERKTKGNKETSSSTEKSFSIKIESKDLPHSESKADQRSTNQFSSSLENHQEAEVKCERTNVHGNTEEGLMLPKSLERSETGQSSLVEASDESTITAFNDSREEPFWLNDAEEKTYEYDKEEKNDKKAKIVEKDKEELKKMSDDPLIPILTTLVEERHIPSAHAFMLEARKESEAKRAEMEAINDPSISALSPQLEKGEVCFGRDNIETPDDHNHSFIPVFNISEIKEEPYPEKFELEAAESKDSNEEGEIEEEKPELNGSIMEERKSSSLKRKLRSKTKAKKAKKRIKVEIVDECKFPVVSFIENESNPIILKSPIIAKKGELLIETNKISPVVQIEKNKEIEEAISKQLEENSLNPVRCSSRPRKMPRIFDESEYAVVTPAKKVKKTPEKKVDPDYRPNVKTRRGGEASEPKPSKTASTEKLSKSPESDSVSLQRIIDLSEKKNRIELFDPLSLNYERTTRSGTRFENAKSLNESEPEVVYVAKNSASNNKKNNLKRNTICSTKGNNSTTKKPEQMIISTRSSQNSRHYVSSFENDKSFPNTRCSARLKNV